MPSYISPNLPRIDLHRHLEGCIRLETVIDLCTRHNLPLPTFDKIILDRLVSLDQPIKNLVDVIPKTKYITQIFINYEVCRRVAWEFLEDAVTEKLDYIEMRFSPHFIAQQQGLDPNGVVAVICETWQEAHDRLPVEARLIAILDRTFGPDACWSELEIALSYRDRGITGVDLAGDEARHPAKEFEQHFLRGRDAGLHRTAHAGEFAGAESVMQTLMYLDPERIGHGVHAVDDNRVMDLLVDRGTIVECCPTSNFFMGAVESMNKHPLLKFLERGIYATINTDDPTWFHKLTLEREYQIAHHEIGLDRKLLNLLQLNSLRGAFLEESERNLLVKKILTRQDNQLGDTFKAPPDLSVSNT